MIRRLEGADVDAFFDLRIEGLRDSPLAFTASPEDEQSIDAAGFRKHVEAAPDAVILGAFADGGEGRLVGIVGVRRDPHAKGAHKAHVWGMYVTPSARGRGVGRRLIDAAIAHARGLTGIDSVELAVAIEAPAARTLYESEGFVAWGEEPDAVRHDGRSTAVVHMALALDTKRKDR